MQAPALDDTIVAVSSGWRADPLGIVRLSGPAAFGLLEQVGAPVPTTAAQPRPGCGETRVKPDQDLDLPATIYWFRKPRSYTGQDVAEIHTVGSLPALRALAARLIELGARRALPGEFTARAFLNGRLDADRIEAVLTLINAQDEAGVRQAARAGRSGYRARLAALGERLTELIALVEAGIDFVEEEDVRFISPAELRSSIDELAIAISGLDQPASVLQRAGKPHVALAGLPNAGKSTLFNALLGYERAIVSPVLGTTRDVLSAELEVGGVALVLQDCAGLGASTDELESAAHLAAEQTADQADLVLWLHDCTAPWDARETTACHRIPEDRRLLVISKLDQLADSRGSKPPTGFLSTVEVSCVRGQGLERLREVVGERLEQLASPNADAAAIRHSRAALHALARAWRASEGADEVLALPEIVAAELRHAWETLDELGRGPLVNDVLATIFGRFCIGK